METIERLSKLGFKKVVNKITELKEVRRKMAIAYEHFRYVKQEKIDVFNEKLKAESFYETGKKGKDLNHYYKHLRFIGFEEYEEVPPLDVLEAIEKASDMKCFDSFEIAKIQDVVEVKDPIVFGRINKCPDRFFVAQWDDDVNINQILKENEG